MTRITTTNQKKNTTIPGIAYPATVLALATDFSYPAPPELSAILYTFMARRRPAPPTWWRRTRRGERAIRAMEAPSPTPYRVPAGLAIQHGVRQRHMCTPRLG